jgi:hypothetical protein
LGHALQRRVCARAILVRDPGHGRKPRRWFSVARDENLFACLDTVEQRSESILCFKGADRSHWAILSNNPA